MPMLILEGFEGYANVVDNGSGGLCNGQLWEGDTRAGDPRYVEHDSRGVAKKFGGVNSGLSRVLHSQIFSASTVSAGVSISTPTVDNLEVISALALQVDRVDQATGNNIFVRFTTNDSTWTVHCPASGNTFDTGVAVVPNQYTYLELMVELTSASTANITARINGVTVVNQSVAAGGTAMRRASFELTFLSSASAILIDDFYLSSDLQFYGPLAIKRTALTQATQAAYSFVGAGSALACVDEEICDLDDTYVVSSVPGAKQTFTAAFDEPPMFILLSSQTRSEALSATGQRFVDGQSGNYREHPTGYYPETYASKPQILSTLFDGSPLTQAGANAQEYGIEIVNE